MSCVHKEVKQELHRAVCASCGMTLCPECRKFYEPVLGHRGADGVKRAVGLLTIQREFPGSKPIDRESLLTGICSNECWSKFIGPEEGIE